MILKVIQISICFKISYDRKCENYDIFDLKSEFYQYFILTKNYSNDLSHFFLNFSAGIFQIQSRKRHQLKESLALI